LFDELDIERDRYIVAHLHTAGFNAVFQTIPKSLRLILVEPKRPMR